MKYVVTINGKKYDVEVEKVGTSAPVVNTPVVSSKPVLSNVKTNASTGGTINVNAPMPGTVLDVKVSVGQSVNKGDVLLILEAMKMENEITAERAGTIKAIEVSKGSKLGSGDLMVVIE